MFVSKIDKVIFGFGFFFQTDPRNFHIQAVAENFFQIKQKGLSFGRTVFQQQSPDGAVGSRRQSDQSFAVALEVGKTNLRLFGKVFLAQIGNLHQFGDVGITVGIFNQQNDLVRFHGSAFGLQHVIGIAVADIQLRSQNRLDAVFRRIVGKSLGTEHIGGIDNRHCRKAHRRRLTHQRRNFHRPFQQRIGGMHPEMNKLRFHYIFLIRRLPSDPADTAVGIFFANFLVAVHFMQAVAFFRKISCHAAPKPQQADQHYHFFHFCSFTGLSPFSTRRQSSIS